METKLKKDGVTNVVEDPTFGEAIKFYDRLINNFDFHMSLQRECLEHLKWSELDASDDELVDLKKESKKSEVSVANVPTQAMNVQIQTE